MKRISWKAIEETINYIKIKYDPHPKHCGVPSDVIKTIYCNAPYQSGFSDFIPGPRYKNIAFYSHNINNDIIIFGLNGTNKKYYLHILTDEERIIQTIII